jgi:hypothetical protein
MNKIKYKEKSMKHLIIGIATITILLTCCTPAPREFRVQFDSNHEVSGRKFAIRDINPDLPRDWDEYNYVTLEFRITTSQRFHVGFTTDYGYNELRVLSYVANGWNKLTIPLRFYRRLPDPRIDVAATFNQPRYTGWINLGGRRGELRGVDSIGIRMRVPIGDQELVLRNITLHVEDPGDLYLGDIPVVDEFGQHNLVDFPEKIHSIEQLQAEWAAEAEALANFVPDFNFSRFGGFLQKNVGGTGFFRVEEIEGRWWFVDPEGYLFLSHGVNCVEPGRGGAVRDLERREGMVGVLPPEQFVRPGRGGRQTAHFGQWNLYRRFGENFREKSNEMAILRMKKWGLNTIANWSSTAVYSQNRIPHTLQLRNLGLEGDLMGFADIFAPGYAERLDAALAEFLTPNRYNPWILGYFVFNEPAWLGQEVRLANIILDGNDRPIKTELQNFLREHGSTDENKRAFIYKTFDTFLQTVNRSFRRHAPNHLNLGIRFAGLGAVGEELMEISGRAFDVFSFNAYSLSPSHATMDRILQQSGLPMIIGEWHHGTVDRGMAPSLWQVNSEEERGVAYRFYAEQGFSHPGLIGIHYFQWTDQDLMGRSLDGENLNCGLIDVTDRPYHRLVSAIAETARRLFYVHAGITPPFNQKPVNARGHEGIPDVWNVPIWEGYDWLNR